MRRKTERDRDRETGNTVARFSALTLSPADFEAYVIRYTTNGTEPRANAAHA